MKKFVLGRRFMACRKHDVSGVSGTGIVAEGIQFHDGQIVVSWFGKHHIFECPKSLKTWLKVHGHGGATRIIWIDPISMRLSTRRKLACAKKAKKSTR